MLQIDFKFPDWAAKISSQEERINRFIAAQIQTNRGMIFDSEGAHNGRSRWAPLTFRRGQVLSQRGTLRKSIAPNNPQGTPGPDGIVRFAGETITVGTNLLYARMMNNGTEGLPGGVLRPKNAKALKIPLPSGIWASNTSKQLAKEKALRKARAQRNELIRRIDYAQTEKSERSYREKLRALDEKVAKGAVKSEKFIFRKWVKIPARPFDDWNDVDQKELDAALFNLIVGIINE